MFKKRFLPIFLSIFFFQTSNAQYVMTNFFPPQARYLLGAQFGLSVNNSLKTQTFPIIDESAYIYTPKGNANGQVLGVLAGIEFPVKENYLLQLALKYSRLANLNVDGTVYEGADAQSADEFSYRYNISSQQLMVESKLLYIWKEKYYPYLQLGLGRSVNDARNYSVDYPIFLTFSPLFENKSTNAFAYSLGLGVDWDINSNCRVGIGYRYLNIGKITLGAGRIDDVPIEPTLEQSSASIHEVLAEITYLF